MHMCQQTKQAQLTPLPCKALGPLPFLVFFSHVRVCDGCISITTSQLSDTALFVYSLSTSQHHSLVTHIFQTSAPPNIAALLN